jgi:predicted ribosome quality control (RQC) complex YloA/Tae2 family protein
LPVGGRGAARSRLPSAALGKGVARDPSRARATLETAQVVQPDPYTLSLRLRTPLRHGWLHLSWHPTAARACVGPPPPRGAASEAFSFAEAAAAQLRGLVLTGAALPAAWERVAQLSFGVRPGEAPTRLAFCEVQGRLSNLVLADAARNCEVLVAAHQVGGRM